MLQLFELLAGAIAGIALLAGAAGTTNVLMVSVHEQVREIGERFGRAQIPAERREIAHLHRADRRAARLVARPWPADRGKGYYYFCVVAP